MGCGDHCIMSTTTLDRNTLLLTKSEVARLLSIGECIDAVEKAFSLHAQGKAQPPKVLGLHVSGGAFHIKSGVMTIGRDYFVSKTNANFPANPKQNGLPTIQGVVVVCDAVDGRLLALLDSIELTIIRTGAATGVAARHLSKQNSRVATICGCGNQGRVSLHALSAVRHLEKFYAYDSDYETARKFAEEMTTESNICVEAVKDLASATRQSDIIVTCTTSRSPFLELKDVMAGTFIAAVGADSEDKQELHPALLAASKVVTDLTEQAITIGELHHAISTRVMTRAQVHAELGEVIAGTKPGRTSENEIIIFDSTGMALQDVAAAAIVYERAIAQSFERKLNFAS
jgi:alanine dehydrogenase